MQPCLSPVWDTALAGHALLEAGGPDAEHQARRGLDWLKPLQVLDIKGDWAAGRPNVRPGGWAFQYANPHFPDLDDTAVVVMAMDRATRQHGPVADVPDYANAIARAREWVEGLQSSDGGWAAFDADNNHHYLNHIPFSDHGALLDPPHRRCHGPRRLDAVPARRDPRQFEGPRSRRDLPPERSGGGRLLVRPLGHELHLRHLVGALRPECRRGRPGPRRKSASRWPG